MSEGQPTYVFVCADELAKSEGVELPAEEDGNLLLSVLQSQFEGASGLKYRNPTTGGWRAVKLVEGTLCPPSKEGWGDATYVVVLSATKPPASDPNGSDADASASYSAASTAPSVGYSGGSGGDGYKRKLEDVEGERASKNPRSSSPDYYAQERAQSKSATSPPPPPSSSSGGSRQENLQDLIVLGLEYGASDEDLKNYFKKYGEVTHAEVKKDAGGKSRGFGFVRFADAELQRKVHGMKHAINGRRIELKLPRQSPAYMPTKLFIGCLPLKPEVTTDELTNYFGAYGKLDDVYIPRPYRGFGFVSFNDPHVAQKVLKETHTLRKSVLNITTADPKGSASPGRGGYHPPYQPHYPPGGYDPYNQQPNYYNYGYGQPAQQAATNTHYAYAGPPQSTSYGYAYQSGGNYAPPPPPSQGDKQGQGYMQQRSYAPTAAQQRHDPSRQQPSGYHYSQPPAAYNSQAQVTAGQAFQQQQQRQQGAERGGHYVYGGERAGFGGEQRLVAYPQRDVHQTGQPQQQQGQHYDPKSAWQNY